MDVGIEQIMANLSENTKDQSQIFNNESYQKSIQVVRLKMLKGLFDEDHIQYENMFKNALFDLEKEHSFTHKIQP